MNLLTDPILRVQTSRGLERLSLPQLLAALGTDDVFGFPGIQRHQEDAFYVFLCYLGAATLARAGTRDPVQNRDFWRQSLQDLTGNSLETAWSLVVEDLNKPAFMQPPLPPSTRFSRTVFAPDAIDATEIPDNHDVKLGRASASEPDQWVFSLVSANLNATYSKGGKEGFYYPTVKSKKNRVGRVYVRPTIKGSLSDQWKFDIPLLLELRDSLSRIFPFKPNGLVATWVQPWDLRSSLDLNQLDLFFIEVTRAIRLGFRETTLYARYVPSKAPRIGVPWLSSKASPEQKKNAGNLGDPFIPIEQDAAISVSSRGWGADLIRRIIFLDNVHWPLLELAQTRSARGLVVHFASLARSSKGSEGYVTFDLEIPPRILSLFGKHRDKLQQLSKSGVQSAGTMASILGAALLAYLQVRTPEPEAANVTPSQHKASVIEPFLRKFESAWSDAFFRWLWSVPEPIEEEPALRDWALQLKQFALRVLEVETAMPGHAGRAYKAKVAAQRVFNAGIQKHFPILKEAPHDANV